MIFGHESEHGPHHWTNHPHAPLPRWAQCCVALAIGIVGVIVLGSFR